MLAFLRGEFSRGARLCQSLALLYCELRFEDESMLTEQQVRTAIANGIRFVNRTREPYGLWFMGMMHIRFKVPEFADALKRYDEEIAARPKEAPVLQ